MSLAAFIGMDRAIAFELFDFNDSKVALQLYQFTSTFQA